MQRFALALACMLIASSPAWAAPVPCTLTWTANQEPDLAGYKVYRSGTLLATLGTVTTYDCVRDGDGQTIPFAITAYDTAGNESVRSASVSKLFPLPPDVTPPAVPGGLQIAQVSPDRIVIVASIADCPRVVTSTRGSTAQRAQRTIVCMRG